MLCRLVVIRCKAAITLLIITVIMTASCNRLKWLFFTLQSSLDTVNTDIKKVFLCWMRLCITMFDCSCSQCIWKSPARKPIYVFKHYNTELCLKTVQNHCAKALLAITKVQHFGKVIIHPTFLSWKHLLLYTLLTITNSMNLRSSSMRKT